MEIGGLMAHAFKIFLGNPDILAGLITITVFTTLLLTIIEITKKTEI